MAHIPVYHLEGGILAYLDQVPEEMSKFHGECFVFDQRTAVTHGLHPSTTYTLCHACRHPIHIEEEMQHHPDQYRLGVSCSHCYSNNGGGGNSSSSSDAQRRRLERYSERQKQIQLAAELGTTPHLFDPKELIDDNKIGQDPMGNEKLKGA
jgi:UPF0176 protein